MWFGYSLISALIIAIVVFFIILLLEEKQGSELIEKAAELREQYPELLKIQVQTSHIDLHEAINRMQFDKADEVLQRRRSLYNQLMLLTTNVTQLWQKVGANVDDIDAILNTIINNDQVGLWSQQPSTNMVARYKKIFADIREATEELDDSFKTHHENQLGKLQDVNIDDSVSRVYRVIRQTEQMLKDEIDRQGLTGNDEQNYQNSTIIRTMKRFISTILDNVQVTPRQQSVNYSPFGDSDEGKEAIEKLTAALEFNTTGNSIENLILQYEQSYDSQTSDLLNELHLSMDELFETMQGARTRLLDSSLGSQNEYDARVDDIQNQLVQHKQEREVCEIYKDINEMLYDILHMIENQKFFMKNGNFYALLFLFTILGALTSIYLWRMVGLCRKSVDMHEEYYELKDEDYINFQKGFE